MCPRLSIGGSAGIDIFWSVFELHPHPHDKGFFDGSLQSKDVN
jgi:hypothetical protein